MDERSDLDVLLGDSATNLQVWFEQRNLLPSSKAAADFFETQTWTSAVHLTRATEPLIHYCLNVISDIVPQDQDTVSELIHSELGPACMSSWVSSRPTREAGLAIGLIARLRSWIYDMRPSTKLSSDIQITKITPGNAMPVKFNAHAFTYIVTAGLDAHAVESREQDYHLKLTRIRSVLGVNSSEVARLLGVSREAIRKWDNGDPISSERWSSIDELYADVEKLLTYIKPENLPAVVRRHIPALSNQTPLQLLASKRSDELLTLYERLTSYQTTA
jgi:DNA-binding transcriptional regulator YiaG